MNNPLSYFDKIYIINLKIRTDRKKEIEEQFSKIGIDINNSNVEFFSAIRPESPGEFPSIGAKGCFLSHYEVLKNQLKNNYKRILIIEDDLNFSHAFNKNIKAIIQELESSNWSIFYGGYELLSIEEFNFENNIHEINPSTAVRTAHFVGFEYSASMEIVKYFSKILERKGGDPNGGPMHVDGAYTWFRRQNPAFKTFLSVKELGYQRPSRTDIHNLKWFDKIYFIKDLSNMARKFRNYVLTYISHKNR